MVGNLKGELFIEKTKNEAGKYKVFFKVMMKIK